MAKSPIQLALIAADFNAAIVGPMIETARQDIEAAGAVLQSTITVPGCYEIPLLADRVLSRQSVDGLVILGFIERGETQHGQVMGQAVHGALLGLQLKYSTPMGLGIIGPGATLDQAELRKVDYARAAVRAVLRALYALNDLPPPGERRSVSPLS